jgi:hypothetical protein
LNLTSIITPLAKLAPSPVRQGKNRCTPVRYTACGVLTTAAQVAIIHHVRGYAASVRADIRELFKGFTSTEIEEYQKLIQLAALRHTLDNPPAVTSRRG